MTFSSKLGRVAGRPLVSTPLNRKGHRQKIEDGTFHAKGGTGCQTYSRDIRVCVCVCVSCAGDPEHCSQPRSMMMKRSKRQRDRMTSQMYFSNGQGLHLLGSVNFGRVWSVDMAPHELKLRGISGVSGSVDTCSAPIHSSWLTFVDLDSGMQPTQMSHQKERWKKVGT